jgi:hypothetical protein
MFCKRNSQGNQAFEGKIRLSYNEVANLASNMRFVKGAKLQNFGRINGRDFIQY